MAINKLNPLESKTNVISELESKPELSAASLQAKFDAAGEALKTDINATIIPTINDMAETLNQLTSGSLGGGDMMKSVYDTDNDGKVDNSAKLEGLTVQDILLMMNPVGTIVQNITGVNPSEYIGGTWEQWCKGRFPLGLGTPDKNTLTTFGELTEQELALNFTTVEATSGKYYHTLTQDEMPAHSHTQYHGSNTTGTAWVGAKGTSEKGSSYTSNTGGGEPHNNMPPYQTCYYWKRTA